MPNPQGFSIAKFPDTIVDTGGRAVPYVYYERGKSPPEWEEAANYLYSNPSRLHLGRVGLVLKKANGEEAHITTEDPTRARRRRLGYLKGLCSGAAA